MKKVNISALLLFLTAAVLLAGEKDTVSIPEGGSGTDTLVINARLVEIGAIPSNDIYNYVFIMKYRVISVVKGQFEGKEILVGHYNPLVARNRVKGEMDKFISGDVEAFKTGTKHKLTLVSPLEVIWDGAVEDEYIDDESPRYFALKADLIE
ncbi:MAG: hypothetical protein GX556_03925 [Fibrobacter sp.]|nr:hypothetical protein [Fibrobacter sp.]